jgi:carbamate kinase
MATSYAFGLDTLPQVSVAVALGGHALRRPGIAQSYAEQKRAASRALSEVLAALRPLRRVRLLITHGNGPQVGTALQRAELGVMHGGLAAMPLHACVAESQGGIGFSLESALRELLPLSGASSASSSPSSSSCSCSPSSSSSASVSSPSSASVSSPSSASCAPSHTCSECSRAPSRTCSGCSCASSPSPSLASHSAFSAATQVATVLTTVSVNAQHSEFSEPSKPVGACMDAESAERMRAERGWTMRETHAGWRRVVPSPPPLAVQQAAVVRILLDAGVVVIAAGGGGIPVCGAAGARLRQPDECPQGRRERAQEKVMAALQGDSNANALDEESARARDPPTCANVVVGVDAVVDKDRATALLASEVGAQVMAVLTPVDGAFVHFGSAAQALVGRVTVSELQRLLDAGHFPKGSMGPKVESALQFVRAGGRLAIITRASLFAEALADRAGTRVVPDPDESSARA